jgi:hypothetical protein
MDKGKCVEHGPPRDLLREPSSIFAKLAGEHGAQHDLAGDEVPRAAGEPRGTLLSVSSLEPYSASRTLLSVSSLEALDAKVCEVQELIAEGQHRPGQGLVDLPVSSL